VRFDLLSNSKIYLVDVQIKAFTIEAGWVYFEPGLTSIEVLSNGLGKAFKIKIPESLRSSKTFGTTSFPNEPVEFLRGDGESEI